MFRFPWSNFHELNLDWILEVVKEAKEIFVNGRSDIDNAVETANEALEIAEQAASAVIADGAVTIPKLNNEVLKTTAYVIVGNRADEAVPAGAYVYLKKSEVAGLTDGLYIAAANIPADSIVTPAEFQQPTELHNAGALNVLKTENTAAVNALYQLRADTFGSIRLNGTNNTGSTITTGTFFYNNGSLLRAKTNIQNGSAITIGTNAETVTDGGLNSISGSTYTTYANGTVKIWRCMRLVILQIDGATASGSTTVATIADENYIPSSVQRGAVVDQQGAVYGRLTIANTGAVVITAPRENVYYGSVAYFV